MRRFRNVGIALGVLVAAAGVATSARSGTAGSDSVRLPKIDTVTVSDINDRGQVVGSLTRADGASRGFLWTRGSLQVLGRGKFAQAGLINERGQILGTSGDNQHGVLWEYGGVMTLGLQLVWDLNEAGQVLGGNLAGDDITGYAPAPAVWTSGTGSRSLPFGPGTPTAMNDLGQVVGQLPDGRAAEWQDGKLTDLGPGIPLAINDRGDILGRLGLDTVLWQNGAPNVLGPEFPVALNEHGEAILFSGAWPSHSHALLWRNGTMTDLGTLGGKWSIPTAVSDSGQVVGYSTDSNGRQHGFVWRNGVMTRLPAPAGYGGSITRALAINDRNQIVGDNCRVTCGDRSDPGSKFAVLWTLRPHKVETRLLLSRRDSRRKLATPRTMYGTGAATRLGHVRNGRWIAYATTPPDDVYGGSSNPSRPGSDVFLTHVGGRPRLVAGRGSRGEIGNVCPAFSPSGRLLAFARIALGPVSRSTIVVVRIAPRGPMRAGRVVLEVPSGAARCPRWSSDSSRLAYLYRGKVVIRGLDGSRQQRAKGDPTILDFDRSRAKIVSPTGELIARRDSDTIVVSRPGGPVWSTVPDDASYAIAGWSPDGRNLLLMKDVGGGFRMRAVSVDPPFVSSTVVAYARVNGARSWPGYGDVSWQPEP